jgi:glycosyltransferase involved in cell wall biosynthesis
VSRRPVCMVVHSYYEEDPRVRREAESLVERGRPVDVVALRRPGAAAEEVIDGVHVRRLDVQRHQGGGLATYVGEYLDFLVRATWAVTAAGRRRHYALVQVHTLPDFLVLAGLPLRLAGVPTVIDLHEAMPEFFRMRFARVSNPVVHAALRLQERFSIGLARHAITANGALGARLLRLGIPARKVSVIRNGPSLRRFDPSAYPARPFLDDGVLRLVYAGALTPTYEVDVAIEALGHLRTGRPGLDARLEIYGRGDAEEPLRARAAGLGLSEVVTFHGRVPIEAVPAAIAAADIGLAPTRRDAFTDLSLSTKIFEYAAMGKPVVASRLPMIGQTFAEGSVFGYEAGDPGSLAAAVLEVLDDPAARDAAVAKTLATVRELSWEKEADVLFALVESIARDGRPPGEGGP